jgi:septal ring factor EnvC (AmiA/AmiB activator)
VGDSGDYWTGLNYASYLSERDAEVLREFRRNAERSTYERGELERTRGELARVEREAAAARDSTEAARGRRAALLARVQKDQRQHQAALAELQTAARDLNGFVETVPSTPPRLDVRKFRGLLEWPAPGRVSAGFGNVVNSKFGTDVPHPGWDIESPAGTDIEAVFDGRVVFADWMRGYGLTVIVDHGGGVLSVYAHASAVVVGTNDEVRQGQTLGQVGDTGSLRGPFLYFELRLDGQPVDPASWLRPR